MDAKSRKALSWSLSILVHVTILFFIIRAGIHYVIPEGEVTTGQTIDVVEGNNGGPTSDTIAADKMVPSLPAHTQNKETKYKIKTNNDVAQKESSVTENEPPPQFIPDKEPQDVIPEDKTDDNDSDHEQKSNVETADNEQAPAVPPPAPTEAPKTVAKNLPQKTETSETKTEEQNPEEMQPVQETQNPESAPEPPPSNAETANTGTAAPPPSEPQNSGAQAPQTPPGVAPQANSGGSGHPAFGAPGTMLDESKLVEVPGNAKPTYPWMAKLRRQEGTVVLRAYIKSDGHVDLPILDKSSGYASLDQECIRTYSHWKYKPGPSGWVLKPFHFALKKN